MGSRSSSKVSIAASQDSSNDTPSKTSMRAPSSSSPIVIVAQAVAPRTRSAAQRFARMPPMPTSLQRLRDLVVRLRPTVAEELPHLPHLLDLVEIEVGGDDRVAIAGAFGDDLPARVREVAAPVELSDVPRLLVPDAVDSADEVAVGDGVRRLLELPQVLGKTRHRGRGVEDDLRPLEAQDPRALGKVAVVADVDADRADGGLEHRIAEVPRLEVELLPEARRAVGDVVLAVLPEAAPVGVEHGGGVVVDAGHVLLVDRQHQHDGVLPGQVRELPTRRPARHLLHELIPGFVLTGAEVGAVEQLLEADDLGALRGGLGQVTGVLVDHRPLDLLDGTAGVSVGDGGLDKRASYDAGHTITPSLRSRLPPIGRATP